MTTADHPEQVPAPRADVEERPHRDRGSLLVAAASGLVGALVGAALVAGPDWQRTSPTAPASDSSVVATQTPGVTDPVERVADVAQAVLPSVVRVDVRGVGAGTSGSASGVVWDDRGHIVTNDHVVAAATTIAVTLADGSTIPATVVGTDPTTDLAVILVEGPTGPPVHVSDQPPRVGQMAVAVGSPFGLDGSVTSGVISAVGREIDLRTSDGELVRLAGVLQTDAAISPGNSGGALADGQGRLVGISSAVLGDAFGGAVGFAIAIDVVTGVVDGIIATGRVPRPQLGLVGATAPDNLAGVTVQSLTEGGPAAAAGIVPGDRLTSLDGRPIQTMHELVVAIRASAVGATIVVAFVRDGAAQTTTVTLTDASGQ